ncbi:MAG: ABC transporter ATP-binding protein, partial [Planctomycetota bacterium]
MRDARQPSEATDAPAEEAGAPVRVARLVKSFGRKRVLHGIDLEFPRGLTTVVLGPSGCGKSVMLKHLVGLLRPDRGEVYYETQRIDALSERRLAPIRRNFGFLFQQGALFDSMTVGDNVAFPLRELHGGPPYDEDARVRRVLRMVGLEHTILQYPTELSGGQQKRVALARAIVTNPRILLLDEPFAAVDAVSRPALRGLLTTMLVGADCHVLVVSHDPADLDGLVE